MKLLPLFDFIIKFSALQEQSSAPIIEALSLLELVLYHSPANFHVKLLLVKLYHLLGMYYSFIAIHFKQSLLY